MTPNHKVGTDNLTGLVFRATIKFHKQVKQVVPEGLGLLTPSVFPDGVRKELTLCELCASVVSEVFLDLHIRNYYQKVVFIFPK